MDIHQSLRHQIGSLLHRLSVFSHELFSVTWHISVHVILPLKQVQARVSHAA